MKPFYALLLVAFIVYVRGDPCDKYAANTFDKEDRGDGESDDQTFELYKIVAKRLTVNVVGQVTPSTVLEGGDVKYCSALTHAKGCQGIGHSRLITTEEKDLPKQGDKKGADKLKFKVNYVAVTDAGYAIKYEFNMKGDNEDDYIFLPSDEVTVTKLTPIGDQAVQKDNLKDDVKKYPEVINRLRERFAMFHVGNDFALYVRCDAKGMWVTYDEKVRNNPALINGYKDELEGAIQKLYNKMKKDGIEEKDLPKLEVIDIKMAHILQTEVPVKQ